MHIGKLKAGELVVRVWKEMQKDKIWNKSAELAFFLTLAFFPFLIFLIALLGFLPGAHDLIIGYLATLMPKEAFRIVHRWTDVVLYDGTGELVSFSLLFALWSASNGMAALIDALNEAYEVREGRPYWKFRLMALILTLAITLLVVGGSVLVTFGGYGMEWVALHLHLDRFTHVAGEVANYAIGLAMLILGISILHYYGPNVTQRWQFFTPGAFTSVLGILVVSFLFSVYLRLAPSYNALYGSLGAIIIFMVWLYLISLMIIIGAELNDEVKKAAGHRPRERELAAPHPRPS